MKYLFLILFNVFLFSLSHAQQIFGEDSLCNGSVRTYWVDLQPNMTQIIWTPQNGGSIFQWSAHNDSIQVQWNSNQDRFLNVQIFYNNGSSSLTSRTIHMFNKPDPAILSNYNGGCGEINIRKEGDVIQVIEENTFSSCQVVCENTLVRYHAVTDLSGSSFTWSVSNTNITNITQYPNGDSLDVEYTGIGNLQIFLNEISAQGCQENITFCVEVIDVPEANITSLTPINNSVIEVCLNQTVEFLDSSIVYGNSPITGYSWYVYDYVNQPVLFSGQENAQYKFDVDGNYLVILEIVNNCGCKDFDTLQVIVHDVEGPIIDACICPKCENDTTRFQSPSNCGSYLWDVDGGQIIQGQNSDDITVVWDQINPNGFATVSLQCIPSACPVPTAISFPIITDHAAIDGLTTICKDNSSSIYNYKVPFWQGVSYTWGISPPVANGQFGPLTNQSPNKVNLEILPSDTVNQYTIWVAYEHDLISCTGTDTILVDILPSLGIQGNPIVCAGQENIWYANPRSAAYNYNWYVNGVLNNTFHGDSIKLNFNTANQYNISLSNAAYCNTPILSVTALHIPPMPQAIQGETDVCLNFAYNYSSSPTSSDFFINWTINDGNSPAISDQGSNITFQWHNNMGPYILEAQQIYNNGSCPSLPVQLEVFPYMPPMPVLNGPDTVCANSTSSFYATAIDRFIYTDWETTGANSNLATIFNAQDTTVELQFGNTNSNLYQAINLRFNANVCGSSFVINKTIYVGPAPDPIIEITGGLCPNDILTFSQTNSALTSGNYNWTFGDGTLNSTLLNPTHSYLNGGTYFVNLTITSPNGCLQSVSANATINVLNKPVASATLWSGSDEYCLPLAANEINAVLKRSEQFNPSYQYYWYCSGSAATPTLADTIPNSLNQDTFVVNYPNPITSPTMLYCGIIAIDTNGCWNFDPVPISIEECPTCTDGSAVDINIGFERNCQNVQFRDTILPNPSVAISQVWKYNYASFGSSQHDPTFTYPHSGMYRPSFTVTYYGLDSLGNIDSSEVCFKKKYLNVPVPMVVDFDTRYECNATGNIEIEWLNLTDFVALDANGNGTNITFTEWQINNSSGANVYTGTTPPSTLPGGTYTVQLSHHAQFVNSNYAINLTDTCSKTGSITVPEPASANFVIDTNISCQDNALFFTDLSTAQNNISSWYWDFGDGQSSLLQNPIYSWSNPMSPFEDNNITLSISDKFGCSSQFGLVVRIYPNNLGGIVTENTSCGEAIIQFGFDPSDPTVYSTPYYYNWSTDTTTTYPASFLTTHQTGAYWLEIEDLRTCTKKLGPVVVDIPNTPMATISGPNSVCYNESFTIYGPGGANLSYQWFYHDGSQWLTVPISTSQNLHNNFTINQNPNGNTVHFKLLLTYTDPQTGIVCTEYSEELHIKYLAKLPVPYIIATGSTCTLLTELSLANSALLNQYSILWSNGANNVPNIIANHYGYYKTTLVDSNAGKTSSDMILKGPYPFYELPTGCYDICAVELPVTLEVNQVFNSWVWYVNGVSYTSGSFTAPNLVLTNTMAPLNTTVELVLSVKEFINGEICLHNSDTIFLTIEECPEVPPCSFEPSVSINDTSFCEGDQVVVDIVWSDFNYLVGYSFYLDNVYDTTFYNNPIDSLGLLDTTQTILQIVLQDSAVLGITTICFVVAEDSLLHCLDTICFSYEVNSCSSACDEFLLNPQFTYSIDSGFLNIKDISTGSYEIVDFSYNGVNITGLPHSTAQFLINNYGALSDVCITIVAFVGDECCKQSLCKPLEISCDELNLISNFDYSNAFSSYDFSYAGNQNPTVLLWTFPDGTQLTGNIQNNPNILNPSWYDANGTAGEVCLKTIIHLSDSICCVADTCIRLKQNPFSPCEQLESFTDFTTQFTDHTDFYSVLFTPVVSNQGNYVFQYNKWEIDGQNYPNWAETVKFTCHEEAYFVEVCLIMRYYDPISERHCEYKVCRGVEIPPCSYYKFKPIVYPNPTSSKLTIDMQKMSIENSSYEIVDLSGKSIIKGVILNQKTLLDLKDWSKEVYKVIIKNQEDQFINKIIKN